MIYLIYHKEVVMMCYNCGCGIPDDPMGKGRIKDNGGSLTETDIKQMAQKWGMTIEATKKEMMRMLTLHPGGK